MNTKIHSHLWVDSVNKNCPFCGKETQLCSKADCWLYRCKNKRCKHVFLVKGRK